MKITTKYNLLLELDGSKILICKPKLGKRRAEEKKKRKMLMIRWWLLKTGEWISKQTHHWLKDPVYFFLVLSSFSFTLLLFSPFLFSFYFRSCRFILFFCLLTYLYALIMMIIKYKKKEENLNNLLWKRRRRRKPRCVRKKEEKQCSSL